MAIDMSDECVHPHNYDCSDAESLSHLECIELGVCPRCTCPHIQSNKKVPFCKCKHKLNGHLEVAMYTRYANPPC